MWHQHLRLAVSSQAAGLQFAVLVCRIAVHDNRIHIRKLRSAMSVIISQVCVCSACKCNILNIYFVVYSPFITKAKAEPRQDSSEASAQKPLQTIPESETKPGTA